MSRADELWEKYKWNSERVPTGLMTRNDFRAALKEYGAEVRKRDAEILKELHAEETMSKHVSRFDLNAARSAIDKCAAAIEGDPLP